MLSNHALFAIRQGEAILQFLKVNETVYGNEILKDM